MQSRAPLLVVFLHGFMQDGRTWDVVRAQLVALQSDSASNLKNTMPLFATYAPSLFIEGEVTLGELGGSGSSTISNTPADSAVFTDPSALLSSVMSITPDGLACERGEFQGGCHLPAEEKLQEEQRLSAEKGSQDGQCLTAKEELQEKQHLLVEEKLQERWSLSALVDTAHQLVEREREKLTELFSTKPRLLLVGYSLGGRVALEYVRRHENDVDALVLESAGIGPVDAAERARLAARNESWARRFEEATSMADAVAWWESLPIFASQAALPQKSRQMQHLMRMESDSHILAALCRAAGAHTMPLAAETSSMLNSLSVPVHYVYGTKDSKYARIAAGLASHASSVQLVPVEAGHNVHLEASEGFARGIAAIAEDVLVRGTP